MFLKIPTVIDNVKMDYHLSIPQIIYADHYMIDDVPDPNSIRIHRVGIDTIIRTSITLDWLVEKGFPFIALDTWCSGGSLESWHKGISKPEKTESRRRVFNIENIFLLRPYTMRSRIDHYVMYVPNSESKKAKEFHITAEQAAFLQSRMSVL